MGASAFFAKADLDYCPFNFGKKGGLDAFFNSLYNSPYTFEFGKLNENHKEIFQKNLGRLAWLNFKEIRGFY